MGKMRGMVRALGIFVLFSMIANATIIAQNQCAPESLIIKIKSTNEINKEVIPYRSRLKEAIQAKSDLTLKGSEIVQKTDLPDKIKSLVKNTTTLKPAFDKVNNGIIRLKNRQSQKIKDKYNLENIYYFKNPRVAKGQSIEDLCREIMRDPAIEYAEPNYVVGIQYVPNDHYYSTMGYWQQSYDDLWGLKKLELEDVWDNYKGNSIIVAVVDTGVNYNHEDLPTARVIKGHDYVNNDLDPMDDNGHGTHVAGIIAAEGGNGVGIIGVAPQAQIMAIKALDNRGDGYLLDVVNGIKYATDYEANIVNCSFTFSGRSSVLKDAVDYAADNGVITIIGAGNENKDVSLFCPANLRKAISVGATTYKDEKATFSNWGYSLDVVAPGGNKKKIEDFTWPPSLKGYNDYILSLDYGKRNGYAIKSGTSMATPHVSGLVALLLSKDSTLTTEKVRSILRFSADDLGKAGRDDSFGYGRINAKRAFEVADMDIAVRITSPEISSYTTYSSQLEIRGFASGDNVLSYSLSIKNVVTDVSEYITPSTNPTIDDETVLGVWQPDKGAHPEGEYELVLAVTITDGTTIEDAVRIILFNFKPGWPPKITDSGFGIVTYADINGDGANEIIARSNDKIFAWKIDGQEFINGDKDPNTIGIFAVADDGDYPPAIGNIDSDHNDLEIIIGTKKGVYAFKASGELVTGWPVETGKSFDDINISTVVIADLNNDGMCEIIATTEVKNAPTEIYVWNGGGKELARFSEDARWVASIAVGNIDGDKGNILEIVANNSMDISCYRLGEVNPVWRTTTGNIMTTGGVVLGDVNNDGELEVVATSKVGDYDGIFILNSEGTIIAQWDSHTRVDDNMLALGDLDKDGNLEVVAKDSSSQIILYLCVWDHKGNLLWQKNTNINGNPSVIADVNSDAFPDIITSLNCNSRTTDFRIMAFDCDGNNLSGWPKKLLTPCYSGNYWEPIHTTLGDIDKDGKIDLLTGNGFSSSEEGIIFFIGLDGDYSPSSSDWPMYRHDAQHTGCYTNPYKPIGTISINDGDTHTSSVFVTLSLSATGTGSGVTQMQFSNDGSNWFEPEAYSSATKTWRLPTVGDGDVDGSGKIVAYDALLALKCAVGNIILTSDKLVRADVDGDGKVTSQDALYILKLSVRKPRKDLGLLPVRLSGEFKVYAKFKDAAGNWSVVVSDSIKKK